MPIKIWVDGEQPSAADMNSYFMQQHAVLKTADESVSNSTTFQNDDHLFAPVLANTLYWVWALILYTGPSSNGDLKINWDGPAGAEFSWISDAVGSATTSTVGTLSRNLQNIGSSPAGGTTGGDGVIPVKGLLTVGSTAGIFLLKWAQLTTSATACTVYANSTLILRRLTS